MCKRFYVVKVCLLLFVFAFLCFSVPTTQKIYYLNPNTMPYLSLDAQKYTASDGLWIKGNTTPGDAENRTYVMLERRDTLLLRGDSTTLTDDYHGWDDKGHMLTYYVKVSELCNVQIYTYQYYITGNNSIYLNVDDSLHSTAIQGNGNVVNAWLAYGLGYSLDTMLVKDKAPAYVNTFPIYQATLTAGVHKINILNRESNTRISQVLLRVNNALTPAPPVDASIVPVVPAPVWSPNATADTDYVYENTIHPPRVKINTTIVNDPMVLDVPFADSFNVVVSPPLFADSANIRAYALEVISYNYNYGTPTMVRKYMKLFKRDEGDSIWNTMVAVDLAATLDLQVGYVKVIAYSLDEMLNRSSTSTVDSFYIGPFVISPSIKPVALNQKQSNVLLKSLNSYERGKSLVQLNLPTDMPVRLEIYDMRGNLVNTLYQSQKAQSGLYNLIWNGENTLGKKSASGRYLYKLNYGTNGTASTPFIYVK